MKSTRNQPCSDAPEGTVWCGGPVDCSKVSLRVLGDGIDLIEISQLLGHPNDSKKRKGWGLSAPISSAGDIDGQIQWILARLTNDLTIWKSLSDRYSVDFFCGLFLDQPNRGASLSPATLAAVGERGATIGFDIYAPEIEQEVEQAEDGDPSQRPC
ncbi:DUF4279 domain-containing protein [Haloferula sp.]|uniref:DUF4279 domain-containing protein n=1 Tax=Haloferula sp. TaxID=2497595 RepID=UPI003C75B2D3